MPIPGKIKEIITQGQRFLITSHVDPDGDAVGSSLAMAWLLKGLGKDQIVYLADPIPYRYAFLPRPSEPVNTLPDENFDAVFFLDCGNPERAGKDHLTISTLGASVNIDHHVTNDLYGSINYNDPHASSTGELIYRIAKHMNMDISAEVAMNIYTAVFTDTGSLRYDNATIEAFEICKEMVQAGVDPAYVAQMIYESHPLKRFILLGRLLSSLTTYKNGTIVMALLSQAMFNETETSAEHSDGFAEELKQIQGIDVAVLMRELDGKKFKISMRSKGTVDVAEKCIVFGGGGHRNAAGCTIEGAKDEVIMKIKEAFQIP